MEAISALYDLVEIQCVTKLTSTVDLFHLLVLSDSESIDVDLKDRRKLLYSEEFLGILLSFSLV